MKSLFELFESALEHYKALNEDSFTTEIDLERAQAKMNAARRRFADARKALRH